MTEIEGLPYLLFTHAREYAARSFGSSPAAAPSAMQSWTRRSNDFCRGSAARGDVGISSIFGILGTSIRGGGIGGGGGGRMLGGGEVGSCAIAGGALASDKMRATTIATPSENFERPNAIAEFQPATLDPTVIPGHARSA
jgi:hypothetical protein